MKRYRVISGSLNTIVDSETPKEALRKSIIAHNPKSLGALTEITEIDAPEEDLEAVCYVSTEVVLREIGRWSDS